MSSLTMREPLAIRLQNVSKNYKLHGSQSDQLKDVLGLQRFGFKTKSPVKEFTALSNISLDVPRGHRIGIVGRNGAGKTTLLKLICGNFAPTFGNVEVNGTVQALMNVGLGFHPEYTGRENVEASLQYNGLTRDEYQIAMEGIIDFCELGDFLDQPFKTYSLGMQARLMFAAATAIRPDILIVDEVLGAGDAYFVAKSKARVEKLVSSGCTMLLVSHSMQQVLELCDEAIWLDKGEIRMQDESFLVVKAYEEHMHAPISKLALLPTSSSTDDNTEAVSNDHGQLETELDVHARRARRLDLIKLQEPNFLPHAESPELPSPSDSDGFKFVAPGGISRWAPTLPGELEFTRFTMVNESGETNVLMSLSPCKIILTLKAIQGGNYFCRYAVTIMDHQGQTLMKIRSPNDEFNIKKNEEKIIEVLFNPLQLGAGDYTISIAVFAYGSLELINDTGRYDLLSRSFQFTVENPSSWGAMENLFFHSAEWRFD